MNGKWKTRLTAVAAAAAILAVSAGVRAADADIDQAREDGMKTISENFKIVKEAVDAGKAPDDAAAKAAETMAETILAWHKAFAPGTETVKSEKVKPEVWSKADEFKAHIDSFHAQALKLNETAKSSDAAALKTQFAAVGGECKACHDIFRVR